MEIDTTPILPCTDLECDRESLPAVCTSLPCTVPDEPQAPRETPQVLFSAWEPSTAESDVGRAVDDRTHRFQRALHDVSTAHESEMESLRSEVLRLRNRLGLPTESVFYEKVSCKNFADLPLKVEEDADANRESKTDNPVHITEDLEMPLQVRRWALLVQALFVQVQKNVSELDPRWTPSESWLRQVRWNNVGVDLWAKLQRERAQRVAVRATRLAVKIEKMRGTLRGSLKRTSRSGSTETIPNMAAEEGEQRPGYWTRFKSFNEDVKRRGFVGSIEEYVVLHPQSRIRFSWTAMAILLMMYDVFMLPLSAFDPPQWHFDTVTSYGAQVYWTLDIGLNFITGVYCNIQLVKNLKTIARAYATTWLAFDVLVVAPLWLERFIDDSSNAHMASVKHFRLLKFMRLLRLAKYAQLREDFLSRFNSPEVHIMIKIVTSVLWLAVCAHVNACCWYSVGEGSAGWVTTVAGAENSSLGYRYLLSLHWAATQFQGSTDLHPGKSVGERAYAALTVFIAIVILAIFVSTITNSLIQLTTLDAVRNRQQHAIRAYLSSHKITSSLSIRIRKYVSMKNGTESTVSKDSEALAILPIDLVMDLQYEVNVPAIGTHLFFQRFSTVYVRLCRRIFHNALKESVSPPEEVVFAAQESAFRMYFIVSGELKYTAITRHENFVRTLGRYDIMAKDYLAEPALWMTWQHKGSLVVKLFASCVSLCKTEFGDTVVEHPPAHASCVMYARRFQNGLSFTGWNATDVIVPTQLIQEDKNPESIGDALSAGIGANPGGNA